MIHWVDNGLIYSIIEGKHMPGEDRLKNHIIGFVRIPKSLDIRPKVHYMQWLRTPGSDAKIIVPYPDGTQLFGVAFPKVYGIEYARRMCYKVAEAISLTTLYQGKELADKIQEL